MKRNVATFLVALICSALFGTAMAAEGDIPWYLPWFSKDQHLYICGPAEEYGLTQQQVSELEADLDRLSSKYEINLYFSISCSTDTGADAMSGYSNLLVERWTRNQLPSNGRAVFTLFKNLGAPGPAYCVLANYKMPEKYSFWNAKDANNETQFGKATRQYLDNKPYLYAFINYVTLANETCAQAGASQANANAEKTASNRASKYEPPATQGDSGSNWFTPVKDFAFAVISVIAGLELLILLSVRRPR